jgi:hypothetical protein
VREGRARSLPEGRKKAAPGIVAPRLPSAASVRPQTSRHQGLPAVWVCPLHAIRRTDTQIEARFRQYQEEREKELEAMSLDELRELAGEDGDDYGEEEAEDEEEE